jgi:anaerobic selenocysteine-containing dehydrogenase
VILPAASHFEFDDVYGAYGQTWLQRAEAVIPPVGESLPNTEIFRRLARQFGFDEPCFTEDDAALMRAALDGNDPRLEGFEPDKLPLDRALPMKTASGDSQVMLDTVAPGTGSGRIELFSDMLEERFGCGVPRYAAVPATYPLKLITPSSSKRTNTTFGGHAESLRVARIEINADDARARNIADGDEVVVFNDLGRTRLRARISDKVMPGVLYSAKGTWLETSDNGQTVNALIPADLKADIMDGACYNDTFVDLTVTA